MIYEYKGQKYQIVERAKLKNPKTREWVPCVIYKNQSETFVRVAWEFDQKFKKVSND